MRTALIIVDPQVDFCSPSGGVGGALAVAGGDEIMPVINELRKELKPDVVVITQDWHPADHTSFASNNPGETLFKLRADDGQMMWPVHCVQGTEGAKIHPALEVLPSDIMIKKGTLKDVDSYSAFGSGETVREIGKPLKMKEETALASILAFEGVTDVWVVGLAFDYCVAATAKDSAILGMRTTVLRKATQAVSEDSAVKAGEEMRALGVIIE
jgi:nicotinamidase/pyrazinamidase